MGNNCEECGWPVEACNCEPETPVRSSALVGLRGISVSPELIKPREQQIAESLVPPSGFLLAWLETGSRTQDEAQPNAESSDLRDQPKA